MQKQLTVYIISWFGNEEKQIAKRREYHTKQIDWFLEKGLKMVILPQFYESDWYYDHKDVTYIESGHERLLKPGEARNILLKHYYATTDLWAIFADNDAVLREVDETLTIFDDLLTTNFRFVDLFVPIDPRKSPFNSTWDNNKKFFEENYNFHSFMGIKGSLFFLRNLKIAYGVEHYNNARFDNRADGTLLHGEDSDFAINLVANGMGSYKCMNLVLNEYGGGSVSTWAADDSVRTEQDEERDAIWQETYGAKGLKKNANGHNWMEFFRRNTELPAKFYIMKPNVELETFLVKTDDI